ncbi:MAG: hypothetical protein NT157_03520 [Candidatus Micrarchaeota archaeon]|nr:hypothetical protein [Candidatus Micrarchaeota archaeon]
MMRRGQITTEYIIIIGFMLVVLLVLWAQTTFTIGSTTTELRVAYAKHAVTKIAEAADAVYVQGPPAKFSVYITMPDTVDNIMISGREITIRVYTYGGTTDVYAETLGPLTSDGSFETGGKVGGTHKISVEAVRVGGLNMVNITEG